MSKVLIIYYSVYGTTKKYAEWIAQELNGETCDIKNVNPHSLGNYNIIVLGSGLYAGVIQGINIIVKNYNVLKDKKLILYTCGLADYKKTENINNVKKRIEKKIPENIRNSIKIFYLRGGINYKELNLKHKIMMWFMKKMIMKKDSKKMDEEDKEFLESYGKKIDFIDKNNIAEIITYCTN